jgi:hypothetical protein
VTCTFKWGESEHQQLYTIDPPLHTQEFALIHPLTHSFSPGLKGDLRAQRGPRFKLRAAGNALVSVLWEV